MPLEEASDTSGSSDSAQTIPESTRFLTHPNIQTIPCVGVCRPHKNIGADARFPDDVPASIAANGLAGRVHELGEVPESELPALYTGAATHLYPSWIEGFGLPVLETFACGTPVIVGDCPALREVAGDAALSFDPANVDALARALRRILMEPSLAHDLAERGRVRVDAFSWSRLADQTRALRGGERRAPMSRRRQAPGAAGTVRAIAVRGVDPQL